MKFEPKRVWGWLKLRQLIRKFLQSARVAFGAKAIADLRLHLVVESTQQG
ncbi:Uncharacterised protein [Halioglobus japonicus]|nr:Uncharacterised protein [Halioglobus japonicus]